MNRVILVMLIFTVSSFAEQPWPKRVAAAEFTGQNTAGLPPALREALLGFDEFAQDTDKLPDKLNVCRVDLNGDKKDEFIIQSPQSYSNGGMMWVFESHQGKFVGITSLGGGIYFAPRVNGYLEIVAQGRAGGGILTRTLHRYENGKYHLVRIADYRYRETGDELDFVRERNPKEFDY